MSLRDMLPDRNAITFSAINENAHKQLEQQIAEFEARGGKINPVPFGATADSECAPRLKNEFTGDASKKELKTRLKSGKRGANKGAKSSKMDHVALVFDGENRSKRKSVIGENIRKCVLTDGSEYYYVQIKWRDYGRLDRLSLEDARALCNSVRQKLGLRDARY